jgi:uncharacterized protein
MARAGGLVTRTVLKEAPKQRLLLDVNVWIALFDDAHVHNSLARALFALPKLKIASCALVENGVLRVLNLPGYSPNRQFRAPGFELVRQKMQMAFSDHDHEFWSEKTSLVQDDLVDWSRVFGHHQITDLYLLALASKYGGALVSFDHRIALNAVKTAKSENLVLL